MALVLLFGFPLRTRKEVASKNGRTHMWIELGARFAQGPA